MGVVKSGGGLWMRGEEAGNESVGQPLARTRCNGRS